jgi:hypothetical protein
MFVPLACRAVFKPASSRIVSQAATYGDNETLVPMGTRQKSTITFMGYSAMRTALPLLRYFRRSDFEVSVVRIPFGCVVYLLWCTRVLPTDVTARFRSPIRHTWPFWKGARVLRADGAAARVFIDE